MTVRIAPAAAFAAAAITTVASAQLSGQPARPTPLTAGAPASSLAVVLPGSNLSLEGATGEGTALGVFSNTAQVIYSAEMMAAAGISAGDRLTSLSYRVDVSTGSPAPAWSVADYQIRLATSANPPEALDPDFTVNRGADYAVVRSGALSYFGGEYPVGVPYNGFGPAIPFDSGFTYMGGDLLLEYTHTDVPGGGGVADSEVVAAEMGNAQFAPGFDGTIANFGGPQGFVTVVRFGVEPGSGTGACLIEGSCIQTSMADCEVLGGVFSGVGVDCGSAGLFNDEACAALPIVDGEFSFSTIGATDSGPGLPELCNEGSGLSLGRDIWYSHVPAANGNLTVSTCGSLYDTRIAAYLGDCEGGLALLACNDDDCGLQSEMTFPVTAGVPVLIRVGGFGTASGDGVLSVSLAACPYDGDGNGAVDFIDLVGLLATFGACP